MDITAFTLSSLQKGYQTKQFSVTEIVSEYLKRIESFDKKINSFITIDSENALKKAKDLDNKKADGPLFGIPFGIKDMFLTKGVRTTAASRLLENYIPAYTSTAITRIEASGAISLGKLNHDAWAHGSSGENSDFGNTLNPWNNEYVPGGSSSGSAAAVAAGFVPFATGTDTGGSIRLPASFTNTVGLKPTYGRVSRYGVIAMASSLDSIGHFTKNVEDSARVLEITQGIDGFDATVSEKRHETFDSLKNGIKGMKIGIPKEFVSDGLSNDVKSVFEESIQTLEHLGAKIEEVSLPHTEYGIATYYIIQPSEVSSNLARYDGVRFGNERSTFGKEAKRRIMLGTYTLSSGYYDAYYKKAMQVRTLVKNDFDKAFESVDILVSPVSPTPPWKFGEKTNNPLEMYLSDALTVTINLAGVPGLALPAGFSTNNLPIGIQFIGPHFSEHTLFRTGYAFEQETKMHERNPNL